MTLKVIYDSRGRVVRLGTLLGRGGEGDVFAVADRPDLAAKVYHKTVGQDKAAKLSQMVKQCTERLMGLTAWPADTLHDGPGGPVTGFLMPKVSGFKVIHTLYGPKSRLAEFPNADWRFLIYAAANVARAFTVVHEHGHVIGDINHGNVVVSDQATVRLIDCDSFHVSIQGHHFPCEIGRPEYTPPELQGQRLRDVIRTPNHDAFGLAVLVFQLLFMGRHPFSGQYLGPGEMPLEKAIQEFRFAYGTHGRSRHMQPPPGALSLDAVSRPVASLFERAFSPEGRNCGGRSGPHEWIASLGAVSKALKQCRRNNGHHFSCALSRCPWCEIEAQSGTVLFVGGVIASSWSPLGAFSIASIWSQIATVQHPGPLPPLPSKSSQSVSPSGWAIEWKREHCKRQAVATGVAAIVAIGLLGLHASGWVTFWSLIGTVIVVMPIANSGSEAARNKAQKALQQAQARWHNVEQRWQNEVNDGKFQAKLRKLAAKKSEYEALPALRQRKIRELEANRRERQLHTFLRRQKILLADIAGIGPGRMTTLQSYGIETADDVTQAAVMRVPGFGPALTNELLKWRRSVERGFAFNPAQGIDPADISAVDREIATIGSALKQALQSGPGLLGQIARQTTATREVLRLQAEQALAALAQAEADWELVQ